jgi:hypothetical protein
MDQRFGVSLYQIGNNMAPLSDLRNINRNIPEDPPKPSIGLS